MLVGFEVLLLPPSSGRLIALMMEAARTSEALVNFYQTTRRYNPEDSHLHAFFISVNSQAPILPT
jgi:hypothetical protein